VTRIYKLLPRDDWEAARAEGVLHGLADDRRDGFIHFSTAEQLQETASAHYPGRDDLVVLEVDAEALGPALKWEASRNGGTFPHLFAPLRADAVVDARAFAPDPVSCGQSPEEGPGTLT
jgi:uncharacterized protein (DUF952 family)